MLLRTQVRPAEVSLRGLHACTRAWVEPALDEEMLQSRLALSLSCSMTSALRSQQRLRHEGASGYTTRRLIRYAKYRLRLRSLWPELRILVPADFHR